jgi:hypothetical protein
VKKVLCLMVVFSFLAPQLAAAESGTLTIMGKRAKVVGKAAVYGTGGGLVVGVASQVFKKKAKNIFMFGSLGMYAGILLGLYVVSTSRGPTPYEGPDTYDDFGGFGKLFPELPSALAKSDPFSANALNVNFLNIRF